MNPNSPNFGWAILAATFLGPIAAILVTRYVDRLRERSARRLAIFRTLMATRRSFLSLDHISALNQIELDFQKDKAVMDVYATYMKHLGTPFDPKDNDRIARERQSLRTKMLSKWQKPYAFTWSSWTSLKVDTSHNDTSILKPNKPLFGTC